MIHTDDAGGDVGEAARIGEEGCSFRSEGDERNGIARVAAHTHVFDVAVVAGDDQQNAGWHTDFLYGIQELIQRL